jgi:hypothetical protein
MYVYNMNLIVVLCATIVIDSWLLQLFFLQTSPYNTYFIKKKQNLTGYNQPRYFNLPNGCSSRSSTLKMVVLASLLCMAGDVLAR